MKKFVIACITVVAVAVSTFVSVAPAEAGGPRAPARGRGGDGEVVPMPSDGYWQDRYYDNYFYWYASCVNRGRWMRANVEGVIDFRCNKYWDEIKWSMDILWEWA